MEERISGGDNLWNKMTNVKVLEWTAAAAKPLKTNDARQNISIQESSTVMARLLVIRPGFNSGIDLELYLIPSLLPGIGMGISFK